MSETRRFIRDRRTGEAIGAFSDSSRATVGAAGGLAERCDSSACEPIHLLLALLSEPTGAHAEALAAAAGVDVNAVAARLADRLGVNTVAERVTPAGRPAGKPLRPVVEAAVDEAGRLGHFDVLPAQLLIGVLTAGGDAVYAFCAEERWPVDALVQATRDALKRGG